MMSEHIASISEQTRLFLGSCLLGLPLGIFLDLFRFVRTVFPHSAFTVFIEDALFTILSVLAVQCYAVMFAHSQLRGFFAVGAMLGLLLYLVTIGSVWMRMLRKFRRTFDKFPVFLCMIWKNSARFFVRCSEKLIFFRKSEKNT